MGASSRARKRERERKRKRETGCETGEPREHAATCSDLFCRRSRQLFVFPLTSHIRHRRICELVKRASPRLSRSTPACPTTIPQAPPMCDPPLHPLCAHASASALRTSVVRRVQSAAGGGSARLLSRYTPGAGSGVHPRRHRRDGCWRGRGVRKGADAVEGLSPAPVPWPSEHAPCSACSTVKGTQGCW